MSGNLNNDFANKSNLNTGDILLFRNNRYDVWNDNVNKDKHVYDDAVIIIKDPWFLDKPYRGLYVMNENIHGEIELITLTSMICNHKWIDVRSWDGIDYNKKFYNNFEKFYRDSIKPYYCCSKSKSFHNLLYNIGCRCCIKKHKYKHTLNLKLVTKAWTSLGLLPDKGDISHWSANDFAKVYIDKPYRLSDTWRLK